MPTRHPARTGVAAAVVLLDGLLLGIPAGAAQLFLAVGIGIDGIMALDIYRQLHVARDNVQKMFEAELGMWHRCGGHRPRRVKAPRTRTAERSRRRRDVGFLAPAYRRRVHDIRRPLGDPAGAGVRAFGMDFLERVGTDHQDLLREVGDPPEVPAMAHETEGVRPG